MNRQLFCEQCGALNGIDASFCTNCGLTVQQATKVNTETLGPDVAYPLRSPANSGRQTKSTSKIILTLCLVVVLLSGALIWNQTSGKTDPQTQNATTLAPDATTATISSTITTNSASTTVTTTTLAPTPFGLASTEFWIDATPMAQPPCDGSYITIIASTNGSRAASGSRDYADGNYLRTDITCDSLNPFFSSGALQGQPIYLVFFGPYLNRYEAQQKCLDLGIRAKANCYVAPLTYNSEDRSVRYGPLDS